MTEEIKQVPPDFYSATNWQETIVDFYGHNPKFLPGNILTTPVQMLTGSIAQAIALYGVYPAMLHSCLELTVNPLYDKGEYRSLNYQACLDAAVENNDPRFNDLAEALFNIRRLFEKDKVFLNLHFAKEIAAVEGNTDEFKFTHFSEVISKITKIHVHQVAELIRGECLVG